MTHTDSALRAASPSRFLRAAVGLICIAWLALAARLVYFFEGSAAGLGMALLLTWVAVGLWKMRSWARAVSKFLLGALIVLDLIATFGPFYGIDHPAGSYGGTVPWIRVLILHVPLLATALVLFAVLDRHGSFNPDPLRQAL